MGHFERKLDRQRSGAAKRRILETLLDGGAWETLETGTAVPEVRFLRFRILDGNPSTPHRLGIFSGADRLLEDPSIDPHLRAAVRSEVDWFNSNLPVPSLDRLDAISFFESDAGECARRIWDLAGLDVHMQVRSNPGKAVYEGEYPGGVAAVAPGPTPPASAQPPPSLVIARIARRALAKCGLVRGLGK